MIVCSKSKPICLSNLLVTRMYTCFLRFAASS